MIDLSPICFVWSGRPLTANKSGGSRRPRVEEDLRRLFLEAGGIRFTTPLYGVLYYVAQEYRPANDADADNVSKPVWDALQGVAYDDDKLVRLGIAGIVAPSSLSGMMSLPDLNLTGVPSDVVSKLTGFIADGETHILYIEIGPLRPAMFRFGLAIEG